MKNINNVGLEVKSPEKNCNDIHCPFHGNLVVRGRQFTGEVTGTKAQKTAVVQWERLFYLPKYKRYEKRKTRLHVHNPECVDVKVGDKVVVCECRKISKTKCFTILGKVEK